jgi:hypothetical protein
MPPRAVVPFLLAAGLLSGCEAVCACPPAIFGEVVYGRVESANGAGIPSAVVDYRVAVDTLCVFNNPIVPEIVANAQGRFRQEIYSAWSGVHCLELRAYDPASQIDTVSILIFADFANPDSTGVVLRLP